ncbi:hypothetical protein ACHAWC_009039 [Mediolabrus comicus]
MSELYELMVDAATILDMEIVPELYVQSSPQANAYTLALQQQQQQQQQPWKKKKKSSDNDDDQPPPPPAIVVVTSALLDRCTDDEIQTIIGHELGHLKCSHSLYLTLGGLASTPIRWMPFVGSQAEQLLLEWKLAAEYSCDRAALLVSQDVTIVAGAMLKLFAGTKRQFRIGIIGGHQVVPWGDLSALSMTRRQMNVDVLVCGSRRKEGVVQYQGGYYIFPGSITGAYSSSSSALDDEKEVHPSFILLAVQGNTMVCYVYCLKDGVVDVSKTEFSK